MNIGQVCIKIAGRDAGKTAVVIEVIDDNFVIIDGNVRRKKCNIRHLEPIDMNVKIAKKAPTQDVLDSLKSLNLPIFKGQKASYAKKDLKDKPKEAKQGKKK